MKQRVIAMAWIVLGAVLFSGCRMTDEAKRKDAPCVSSRSSQTNAGAWLLGIAIAAATDPKYVHVHSGSEFDDVLYGYAPPPMPRSRRTVTRVSDRSSRPLPADHERVEWEKHRAQVEFEATRRR